MKVKYKQTGQIFDMPDGAKVDTNLFEPVGGQSAMAQTSPTLNSQIQQPTQQLQQSQGQFSTQTNQTPMTSSLTGHSLQEHYQALTQARAVGDKLAEADILKDITLETDFQKNNLGTDKTTKAESAKLRKEFSTETKNANFEPIRDAYKRTKDVPDSGAGDLSLIYGYIKALDPNSAVREGEIDISKATASVPNKLITAYERVKKGKLLSAEQRAEYQGEIARFYNEKAKEQQTRNAFYSGLAIDTGVDPEDVIGNLGDLEIAKVPEAAPQENPFMAFLKGQVANVKNYGQDVGVGAAAPDIIRGAQDRNKQAEALSIQAMKEKDPAKRKALLAQANAIFQGSSQEASGLASQFSPDVNENPYMRSLNVATDIVGAASLAGMGKSVLGKVLSKGGNVATQQVVKTPGLIQKTIEKAESLNPKAILGNKQAQAAVKEGANKINTGAIEKAGEEFVKRYPTIGKVLDGYRTAIKSSKTPADLLENLSVWKSAYTESGKVGKTLSSKLLNVLYKAGIEQLKDKAPETYKYRSYLRASYELPKAVGKTLWEGALAKILFKGF